MGTKVLIDGRGRGSLIMDPSFVEKRFFVRSKRYVLSHLTEAYQAGLRGNLLQVLPPLPHPFTPLCTCCLRMKKFVEVCRLGSACVDTAENVEIRDFRCVSQEFLMLRSLTSGNLQATHLLAHACATM